MNGDALRGLIATPIGAGLTFAGLAALVIFSGQAVEAWQKRRGRKLSPAEGMALGLTALLAGLALIVWGERGWDRHQAERAALAASVPLPPFN